MKDTANPEMSLYCRWSWGAFAISWLWLFSNGYLEAALALIALDMAMLVVNVLFPIIHLGIYSDLLILIHLIITLYLGYYGNAMLWRTGRYSSEEQFQIAQSHWQTGGVISAISCLPITVLTSLHELYPHLR